MSLACCGADSEDPGPDVDLSTEMPWAGFEASASSISVREDGTFDRQLQLLNMPAGDASKGLVLGVHPAAAGAAVWTSDLPEGGHLIVCNASVEGGRQSSCRELDGGTTRESIDLLEGDAHQGLVVRGTWPEPVVLQEVNISYQAQDDFFAVRLLD